MTQEQVIINTTNIIYTKLNIVLPNTNNLVDYNDYLDIVLNAVKKPKVIPRSWIDEKIDFQIRLTQARNELEKNKSSFVGSDSFGDGMPHAQSDPRAIEDKMARRVELEDEIIPYLESKLDIIDKKIKVIDMDFDNNVKDIIKDFIEIIPSDCQKDIMKQFYIFRKTYDTIADDSGYPVGTVKKYRRRGFKALADILFNFSQKIH